MNKPSKETRFILDLVERAGYTTDEARAVMEELADADGTRLDMRSATVQLIFAKAYKNDLVEGAKAIKDKREKKNEVQKVEITNLPTQ